MEENNNIEENQPTEIDTNVEVNQLTKEKSNVENNINVNEVKTGGNKIVKIILYILAFTAAMAFGWYLGGLIPA